jgi:type II secretory pathway pseudopilin PulG
MAPSEEEAKVSTGVVVAIVAIAVVLVVLLIVLSMRGRQRRASQRRGELREAGQQVGRAERDRDIAREEAHRRADPDL